MGDIIVKMVRIFMEYQAIIILGGVAFEFYCPIDSTFRYRRYGSPAEAGLFGK